MAAAACADNSADVVYTNGRIYTVNEAQPWAEAFAVKDGRFVAVGTNEEIGALADLGARLGLPADELAQMALLEVELPSLSEPTRRRAGGGSPPEPRGPARRRRPRPGSGRCPPA